MRLHYNFFRDYNPELGRYIQSDLIGLFGGINRVAYVGNNPLFYADSYGLWTNVAVGVGIRLVGEKAVESAVAGALQSALGRRLGTLLSCASIGYCSEVVDGAREDSDEEGGQCPIDGNSNPYNGPVDSPVIVMDGKGNGNAIPAGDGDRITSSPDGTWQQVRDQNGNPTGENG